MKAMDKVFKDLNMPTEAEIREQRLQVEGADAKTDADDMDCDLDGAKGSKRKVLNERSRRKIPSGRC